MRARQTKLAANTRYRRVFYSARPGRTRQSFPALESAGPGGRGRPGGVLGEIYLLSDFFSFFSPLPRTIPTPGPYYRTKQRFSLPFAIAQPEVSLHLWNRCSRRSPPAAGSINFLLRFVAYFANSGYDLRNPGSLSSVLKDERKQRFLLLSFADSAQSKGFPPPLDTDAPGGLPLPSGALLIPAPKPIMNH